MKRISFSQLSIFALILVSSVSVWAQGNLSFERTEILRQQIFLDEHCFGPGIIDGKEGWVTRSAMQLWLSSRPELIENEEALNEELMSLVPEVTVTAIVPKQVGKYIDPQLSSKRTEQAKRKDMPYRSIREFMAERYHTTPDFLAELNGWAALKRAGPGSALIVPAVTPFEIETIKRRSFKEDERLSKRQAIVDTDEKRVYIYEKTEIEQDEVVSVSAPLVSVSRAVVVDLPEEEIGISAAPETELFSLRLVATFPITPGKTQFIRRGNWTMKNSVTWPDWRFDKQLLETGVRGKKFLTIPGGPNNPVGMMWAGLSYPGIGLHGTSSPRTIARSRSAGCIRLANWDIVRLPQFIRPGASVVIK